MNGQYPDYRDPKNDLYVDAINFGQIQVSGKTAVFPQSPLYWTAWYAGRRAIHALLAEARDMGVTFEQMQRLENAARNIAPD